MSSVKITCNQGSAQLTVCRVTAGNGNGNGNGNYNGNGNGNG